MSQAVDDTYWWTEDELVASGLLSGNIITLDVMFNDKGGGAKKLWSIDDGNGDTSAVNYDLLTADLQGVWEDAALNNLGVADRITISSGQILFDLSASLAALGAASIEGLAEGDHIRSEFVYAIQLGNGTLSQAKVVFELWGENDAATIGGVTSGSATEDDSAAVTGTLTVFDADRGQSHTQVVSNAASLGGLGTYSVDADGGWSYTVDNALVQHLGAGETASDTFLVISLDDTASMLVTITIHGVDDAAVLSSETEDLTETDTAADISTSGLLTISDVDSPASFVAQSGTLGLYGTFAIDAGGAWTYSADTAHDEIAAGITYTDTFSVASTDGSLASVTINILGTNDSPVAAAAVTATASEDAAGFGVNLLAGASDPDIGDALHVAGLTLVSGDASGVTIDGDSLTVAPGAYNYLALGESAVITYNYYVVDGNGGSVPQTATITITGENDGPVASLYFQARNAANGTELWSYDGIDLSLVADINPGTGNSNAGFYGQFVEFSGDLYFTAYDPTNGSELRKLDGTTGTVSLVADINPGSGDSSAGVYGGFAEFAGSLYFTAFDASNGYELRKLDGTGAVSLVANIATGVSSSSPGLNGGFIELGGYLYFTAYNLAYGYELRKLDGTTGAVSLVFDINTGGSGSLAGQYGFAALNGDLYFTAIDSTHGNELRKLDGTTGAVSVIDINTGTGNSSAGRYGGFFEFNGDLYFSAFEGTNGNELRKVEGTTGLVSLAADIYLGAGSSDAGRYGGFVEFAGDLYFTAFDATDGYELRKLEGTDGTVSLVADINPGIGSSNAGLYGGFVQFAGDLYFTAFDATNGYELRKLDSAGTLSLVTDINPNNGNSNAGQDGGFVEFAGDLYFSANDGLNGNQLHALDGATGTVSLVGGALADDPRYLTLFPEIV